MDDTPVDDTPTPAPSVEDRLRRALVAGIEQGEEEAGPPFADLADLDRRRALHRRRRRAGTVAAAAALLVAAALGGWVVGREAPPADEVERVAGSTSTTATTAAPGTAPASSSGVEVAGDELPLVRPEGTGGAAPPLMFDDAREGGVRLLTPYGPYSSGEDQPSAPIFSRTLDDGTVLDVRGNRYDASMFDLPPFWEPPGWCFPTGDLYIGARLPAAVGQAAGARYAAAPPDTVMVSTTVVGGPEGAPQWLVVAHSPPDATLVRVAFPGGESDEMAPVDGLAVLTAPIPEGVEPVDPWAADDPASVPSITVSATGADGSEVGRYEGAWAGGGPGSPEVQEGCTTPTALPAPGAERPADLASAEAAVRSVWETAFGQPQSISVEEQLTYLDDARGVADAQAAVRDRYSAEALSQIRIPVDAVVFASPERAFIEYTVDATGAGLGTFPDRFAELVLVDGSWKVTRASACSLAALGGGICELPTEG